MENLLRQLAAASVFAVMGIVIFAAAFWVMDRLAPFSVRKEIAEDQNTALGIVMGSVIVGIAIIIASSISG